MASDRQDAQARRREDLVADPNTPNPFLDKDYRDAVTDTAESVNADQEARVFIPNDGSDPVPLPDPPPQGVEIGAVLEDDGLTVSIHIPAAYIVVATTAPDQGAPEG